MFGLREYIESDADLILSWICDEKSFRQWSADKYEKYPATPQDINSFYDEVRANGGTPFMFCDDDKEIGHFIIRPVSDENMRTFRLGFIIVDSSIRGKGYGKKMLNVAFDYAFGDLKAERVTLGVFENNPKARLCYEAIGFRQWGESIFSINGEEWKCLEMECIR